eukprot:277404-Rhodomonas_salina.1
MAAASPPFTGNHGIIMMMEPCQCLSESGGLGRTPCAGRGAGERAYTGKLFQKEREFSDLYFNLANWDPQ